MRSLVYLFGFGSLYMNVGMVADYCFGLGDVLAFAHGLF